MVTLEVLREQVSTCTKCGLHSTRTHTVFSRGNPEASLCFVGEAPGEEEDAQGLPFVGKSGQLLDKILAELNVDIDKDIYVCNILKCRPPNNRRPTEEESNLCIDYLEDQLNIVHPKVIVALGNTAVDGLINTTFGITKIRGKFFHRKDGWVMPAYHPSYVLRNGGSGPVLEEFKADLRLALNKCKEMS